MDVKVEMVNADKNRFRIWLFSACRRIFSALPRSTCSDFRVAGYLRRRWRKSTGVKRGWELTVSMGMESGRKDVDEISTEVELG